MDAFNSRPGTTSEKELLTATSELVLESIVAEGFEWDLGGGGRIGLGQQRANEACRDAIALLPEEIRNLPVWSKIPLAPWVFNEAAPGTALDEEKEGAQANKIDSSASPGSSPIASPTSTLSISPPSANQ